MSSPFASAKSRAAAATKRRWRISCRRRRGRRACRPRSRREGIDASRPSPAGTTSVWPAKQKCGAPRADPGIEIFDRRRAGSKRRRWQRKPSGFRPFQHRERAGIRRRHRRAADQVSAQVQRRFVQICHVRPCLLAPCIAACRTGSESWMGAGLELGVGSRGAERVGAEAVRTLSAQEADLHEPPIRKER